MKESNRVLLALVLAIALGGAIAASGNAGWLRAADLVSPLGVLWVNAIRMTVIPLVIALLITGVSSAAGSAIGRLGARTVAAFVLLGSFMAVTMIPLLAAAFAMMPVPNPRPELPPGAAEAARQLSAGGEAQTFAGWLTGLIPANPISAAANGSMLQLVLFTLLFAAALSRVKDRQPVLGFFAGVAGAMLVLVQWIILVAPVGVFALVLPLAARAGAALVGAIGFYIVVYSLGCILAMLLLSLAAALAGRIPVARYARALLPSQLIAFSSSSSIATLPSVVKSAEQLEIPAPVIGFVLPLAASLFKAAAPVSWAAGALFVGRLYGVPLGFPALTAVALVAVFLSFGVPGIPRGAFILLTPLFVALGLPVEGIGILIAVDAIPDTFATALNVSGHLAAAALVARS
ncbi:MAG TPA: cation:dicarboxylase symporter family transporter [Myxococcales bacterium]|jgi:Na+/H+-dicarboxylate symporter|nr:cation:dicarboxylase symporter family transporter [Myxococcales bacterium]